MGSRQFTALQCAFDQFLLLVSVKYVDRHRSIADRKPRGNSLSRSTADNIYERVSGREPVSPAPA
jgi:hypothetical protein